MQATTPVDLAVSKVRRAAFELSISDEQQAARMLREALKLQPGHAELLGDLAVLHLQAGRHTQCIQAAREALAADPAHDESAYALALALEATGQWREALVVVEDLVSGPRAERFAQQQPQLAELCRAKLAQLQALPESVLAASAAPPAVQASAPARAPDASTAEPGDAPARPRQPMAGAKPAADGGALVGRDHGTPYAPSVARPQTLGTLLDECSGIRELTLDCFDTILWRHTERPDDVFYDMQNRPAFRTAAIDALSRLNGERYARQLQSVRTGRTEVSLDQIYLAARPGLSAEMLRWLAEDELAAEMTACHAHPGAIRLLRDAKARGMPVTIVSDTYLSGEQLRRLLAHCVPADAMAAIRDIVCSSEHGVCKSQGLFKLARLNLAANAAAILHVGDNKDADVHAPRELGMTATHLLHEADAGRIRRSTAGMALSLLDPTVRGSRPMHMPYRAVQATCGVDTPAPHAAIGHAALGPMMHAFSRWIEEEATTLAATAPRVKLVFLMRDAHLPLQSYRALGGTLPSCSAYISRFSAYAASFRRLEHVDHYLANFAQNLTLPMIARQLLLSPERAEALIAQAKTTRSPLQTFLAGVRQPAVLAEIFAASAAFRARLRRYLEREVGMEAGDTLVLVDLGYAGTIQRVLGPVLREEWGVDVAGRYLLAVNPVDETRKAMIDRSWLDDRALAALQPYVGLIETLSANQGQSAVGYDEDGQPVFEAKQIDDAQTDLVFQIQAECLRFVREAEDYFRTARHMPPSTVLRDEALASFARMLFFPTAQELQHLSRFELEINLGSDAARKLFDLEAGLDGLRRHGLFYVNAVQDVSDLRMTIPAELRAASMELSLSLLAQHRFGLPFFRSEWSVRSEPVQVLVARGGGSVQLVLDAAPTHDGYFSVLVPVSDEPADIALMLGQNYRWIQVHSMELMSFGVQREGGASDPDVRSLFVADGVQDHGDGLLEFKAPGAMLLLPADALTERVRGAIRLVFRPVAHRESA